MGLLFWIVLKISKKRLDHVADLIKAEDENAIWEFFDNGRKKRKEMEIHKKGGVESAFDIFRGCA